MLNGVKDITERLERTDGADRGLDCLLVALRDDRDVRYVDHPQFGRQMLGKSRRAPHDECWLDHPSQAIPRYTASIDAALSLVERRFPASHWTIEPDACWLRVLGPDDANEYQGNYLGGEGKKTALAICLALARALQAQGDEK